MHKKVDYHFPTDYASILQVIDNIDPIKYAKTRNFINGDVTYLSPYISRGVISLKLVKDMVMAKGYKLYEIEKFIQELAWRAYWQHIWQNNGDAILQDLKQPQPNFLHNQMPTALVNATTKIEAIDDYINQLFTQGYMHNHIRMYVASIACNVGKAHWLQPAKWLYYHLLDGDVASNHLSWQWVCGSASNKKYYANQENINKYTGSNQQKTFLDESYETLADIGVPAILQTTTTLQLTTNLPPNTTLQIDTSKPICMYNSYNLDPLWRKNENVNRLLLLEPSHFKKYPVSNIVIDFIIGLSKNIDGVTIYVGEFSDILLAYNNQINKINFKSHPAFKHYKGNEDNINWIPQNAVNNAHSFFSFWNKIKNKI